MKTTNPDTTQGAPSVAVMGDEALTRELIPVFEAHGFEVIPANDERAIRSAAPRLSAAFELTILSADLKKDRIQFLDAHVPATTPIITSSVTVTALNQTRWVRHPDRLIGFSGFPTLFGAPLIDIAPTLYSAEESVRQVRTLFSQVEKDTVCVQDRTGMIVPAIVAQIVNEALMAVEQNTASAREIDMAMKLGAGYAMGPIEWGEKIGFAFVAALLDALRAETGETRFRTSALLRQLALTGKFWNESAPAAAHGVQEQLALDGAVTPAETAGADSETPKKRLPKKKKS